jgi:hypothetical protein
MPPAQRPSDGPPASARLRGNRERQQQRAGTQRAKRTRKATGRDGPPASPQTAFSHRPFVSPGGVCRCAPRCAALLRGRACTAVARSRLGHAVICNSMDALPVSPTFRHNTRQGCSRPCETRRQRMMESRSRMATNAGTVAVQPKKTATFSPVHSTMAEIPGADAVAHCNVHDMTPFSRPQRCWLERKVQLFCLNLLIPCACVFGFCDRTMVRLGLSFHCVPIGAVFLLLSLLPVPFLVGALVPCRVSRLVEGWLVNAVNEGRRERGKGRERGADSGRGKLVRGHAGSPAALCRGLVCVRVHSGSSSGGTGRTGSG